MTIHQIEAVLKFCRHRPVLHSFEQHPLFHCPEMVAFCLETHIAPRGHIALAKGAARAKVLRAKGQADMRRLLANAEANAVETVAAAVAPFGVNPTHYLIAVRYVETFLKVAASATKRTIFFPFQTDVVGSLSCLGES